MFELLCTTVFLEALCDILSFKMHQYFYVQGFGFPSQLLNAIRPLGADLRYSSWCSYSSGISHSAKGYCLISVLETMKTYSAEEGLTEEAVVTKLRICRYHHLYLHTSLKNNSSGWNLYC
jgi:hypothetical protein